MEGLQICSSSVKMISVRNTSGNMSNEWNEVNYAEELREDKIFFLAYDTVSS